MRLLLERLAEYTGTEVDFEETSTDLSPQWLDIFDLAIPQFAVKERKCNPGNFPCGGRCISGKAKRKDGTPVQCRKTLPGQAKNYADFLKQRQSPPKSKKKSTPKSKKKPTKTFDDLVASTDFADYKQVVALGEAFLKENKIKMVSAQDRKKEAALLKKKIKTFQDFKKGGKPISVLFAAEKAHAAAVELRQRKEGQEAQKLKEALISKRGISEQQAQNYASQLIFNYSIADEEKQQIKNIATEFHQLTGLNTPFKFSKRSDRAFYRNSEKLIDVGQGDIRKPTVFHEMGHGLEWSDSDLYKSAIGWAESRAISLVPRKLKDLSPDAGYGDGEIAYEGKYIDPYVGKIYQGLATEVVSMGIERFSSGRAMAELYAKDEDYFNLIVGMLLKP